MKLIAGLGNTGKDYASTRHNAGFMAVRWLARQWQEETGWKETKQQAFIVKSRPHDAILAQPTTMMNESGRAVRALKDYYKVYVKDIVIIHDDADLDLGVIRVVESTRTGAGHHGVLSVIDHVGQGFKRIRIGIGRLDQPVRDIAGWVLRPMAQEDRQKLEESFDKLPALLE